jgi:acyl carrier protein
MEEKIIQILAEIKNDKDIVTRASKETSIIDDIGLDSLQMINFLLRIEDEFAIEFDFEQFNLSNLSSIQGLSHYISTLESA